jgi:hypothetical protein
VHVDLVIPAGAPPAGQKIPGAHADVLQPVFTPRDQMPAADVQLFQGLLE